MSDSPNIAVVRRFYDSKGDPAVVREIMASGLVWDITPGFRAAALSRARGTEDFFAAVFAGSTPSARWGRSSTPTATTSSLSGTTRERPRPARTSRCGSSTCGPLRDGKLTRLQQAADSLVVDRALHG